jgi:hypothetical protein
MPARILSLLALMAGCASTRALDHAQWNVQQCEHQRDVAGASGDGARAARIDADCGAWRAQVAIEQERVERSRDQRRGAGAVLGGMSQGLSAAGTTSAPRQPISCSSTTVGSSTFTSCN